MTRLTTNDIATIVDELEAYDSELLSKTGCTLTGIACRAAGIEESEVKKISGNLLVGVIPITFGEGIISRFCETVAGIVSHIGCRTYVTTASDIAGIADAVEKKADILMFADDDRFVAINISARRVVDNADATAKGYVAGLNLMSGGLKGKDVLVIGCGPVGSCVTETLANMDTQVSVYDVKPSRSKNLADRLKQSLNAEIEVAKELESSLLRHQFIVDATPVADIIRAHHITPETYISAPGVPLGLNSDAQAKISNRLLHDPLQIGVATMVVCALGSHLKGILHDEI
jgi:pyrrolysine biosynthesis protein PylD